MPKITFEHLDEIQLKHNMSISLQTNALSLSAKSRAPNFKKQKGQSLRAEYYFTIRLS